MFVTIIISILGLFTFTALTITRITTTEAVLKQASTVLSYVTFILTYVLIS